MSAMIPLTKIGKGHVERVGKDYYVACVVVHKGGTRKNTYELDDIDPHAAEQQAREFCAHNGIALHIFTVPPEVVRAHLNDIGDFLAKNEGKQVKPQYMRRTA